MSERKYEAQLTLKDRLNYPYYIGDAILSCNKSVLSESEYSERIIIESTKNLRSLIPESWEDDQFKKDLGEAEIKQKTDIRPIVAGNVRISEEICKELGIPTFREETTYDFEKLRRACINLFDRRGLTARRMFTEKMTGRPHVGPGEDIATSEVEEL